MRNPEPLSNPKFQVLTDEETAAVRGGQLVGGGSGSDATFKPMGNTSIGTKTEPDYEEIDQNPGGGSAS